MKHRHRKPVREAAPFVFPPGDVYDGRNSREIL